MGLLPFAVFGCSSQSSQDAVADARDAAATDSSTAARDASNDAGHDAGLVTIRLTTCDTNVYSAEMTVGRAQDFQLVLDTGSTTLAVAAA